MPPQPEKLVEGVDFYMEGEHMVFTTHFLLKRGYCCNSGCRHCPYGNSAAPKTGISIVGASAQSDESE